MMRKEVEESSTKVKGLEKSQRKAERIHANASTAFQDKCMTVKKDRVETKREFEEWTKARVEMVKVSEPIKAERDSASKRYHQVQSSIRQIVKACDE